MPRRPGEVLDETGLETTAAGGGGGAAAGGGGAAAVVDGSDDSVRKAVSFLSSDDKRIVLWAIKELGRYIATSRSHKKYLGSKKDIINTLKGLMAHDDKEVVKAAIRLLGNTTGVEVNQNRIGSELDFIRNVVRLLDSDDDETVRYAAILLGNLVCDYLGNQEPIGAADAIVNLVNSLSRVAEGKCAESIIAALCNLLYLMHPANLARIAEIEDVVPKLQRVLRLPISPIVKSHGELLVCQIRSFCENNDEAAAKSHRTRAMRAPDGSIATRTRRRAALRPAVVPPVAASAAVPPAAAGGGGGVSASAASSAGEHSPVADVVESRPTRARRIPRGATATTRARRQAALRSAAVPPAAASADVSAAAGGGGVLAAAAAASGAGAPRQSVAGGLRSLPEVRFGKRERSTASYASDASIPAAGPSGLMALASADERLRLTDRQPSDKSQADGSQEAVLGDVLLDMGGGPEGLPHEDFVARWSVASPSSSDESSVRVGLEGDSSGVPAGLSLREASGRSDGAWHSLGPSPMSRADSSGSGSAAAAPFFRRASSDEPIEASGSTDAADLVGAARPECR